MPRGCVTEGAVLPLDSIAVKSAFLQGCGHMSRWRGGQLQQVKVVGAVRPCSVCCSNPVHLSLPAMALSCKHHA